MWKLTTRLRELVLEVEEPILEFFLEALDEESGEQSDGDYDGYDRYSHASIEEQDEAPLASFELPEEPPKGRLDVIKLHSGIISRTIIAAARSGHLTALRIECLELEYVFAVRSLVPCWAGITIWHEDDESVDNLGPWQLAATHLGRRLAHQSLWLGTNTSSVPREDPRLASQEVQSLARRLPSYDELAAYLPWLRADLELAQKVADAWNAVLQRDEVDRPWCPCYRCSSYLEPSD